MQHPAQDEPEKTVPVMFHGDEGKYSKGRSIMVMSWGTPLVHGTSMETRWPITVLPSRLMYCVDHQYITLNQLQAWLAERFNAGFNARVNGFRMAFMGTKGDWKFHVQLRPVCRRTPAADLICFDCEASKSNVLMLFTDVRVNASWIATARVQHESLPPMAAALGWHWHGYFADVLHTVWLGVGRDAVGSWVMELLDVGAVADLPVLFVEFDAWCRDNGIHHGIDQFTMADSRSRRLA